MAVKVVTNWQTLMHYAHELGKARKSGDKKTIEEAKKKHDEYVELIKKSDKMIIGRIGDLS